VHWAPGIPHALFFRGEEFKQNSGAWRREIEKVYLVVIACDKREAFAQGSAATKQSIGSHKESWIASRSLSSGGASRRPVGPQ
jgi:hypothetical protein